MRRSTGRGDGGAELRDGTGGRARCPGRLARGAPAEVRRWWGELTPSQQDHLVLVAPELVGSADGVPAQDRDRANRSLLATDAATGVPGAQAAAAALALARDRVDPASGAPLPALLLTYDPGAFGGDGAAAVVYGDPDAADHVAVLVPGFGSDLAGLAGLGRDALTLQQAASGSPYTTAAAPSPPKAPGS